MKFFLYIGPTSLIALEQDWNSDGFGLVLFSKFSIVATRKKKVKISKLLDPKAMHCTVTYSAEYTTISCNDLFWVVIKRGLCTGRVQQEIIWQGDRASAYRGNMRRVSITGLGHKRERV